MVDSTAGSTTTTSYVGRLETYSITTGNQPTAITTTDYVSAGKVLAESVNGTLSYLATSYQGSVVEALDSTGNVGVTASQLYAPYGGVRYSNGSMPTDYGYTGQRSDASTGLDYYGARYYDPTLGQFTSADTVMAGGLNRYGYVDGNPTTATDPSGHMGDEGERGGGAGVAIPEGTTPEQSSEGTGGSGIAIDPGTLIAITLGAAGLLLISDPNERYLQGSQATPAAAPSPTAYAPDEMSRANARAADVGLTDWNRHTVPNRAPDSGGGGGGGGNPPKTQTGGAGAGTPPGGPRSPGGLAHPEDDNGCGCGGVPQGLTQEQFAWLSSTVRAGTVGIGSDDIVVQGSRAAFTARADSDIDLAVRVSSERFDELIAERFGTPNSGSAKFRTMEHAIATGKIQAGELGLHGFRNMLANQLGIPVDLSAIRIGGPFDNGEMIRLC